MLSRKPPSRRSILQTMMTAVVPLNEHGRIKPPVPAPDLAVVCQDSTKSTLPKLLAGRATALQLMFTECETTCPMQGAIFQRVQTLLPEMAENHLQLVSLSINPAGDTPKAMSAWLKRFHAGACWLGATPRVADLSQAKDFFGRGRDSGDDHSTQVHIFSREAMLIFRTNELPASEEIAGILRKLI